MNIETRIAHYAVNTADGNRAHEFSLRMQEFCNRTLDSVEQMFEQRPPPLKVGVHHVYEKIRGERWASGITLGWALYSIADMIRLHTHCRQKKKPRISPNYRFVVSVKTLTIGKPSRLVIPRPSIVLGERSPIMVHDAWTGWGRVELNKKYVTLYLEVLANDTLER